MQKYYVFREKCTSMIFSTSVRKLATRTLFFCQELFGDGGVRRDDPVRIREKESICASALTKKNTGGDKT